MTVGTVVFNRKNVRIPSSALRSADFNRWIDTMGDIVRIDCLTSH